jgi:hypothetical protein
MDWGKFFFIIGAALMAWLLYRQIRSSPEAFSKANLSKSFFTLGILALGLILFVWLLVLMLRAG